MTATLLVPAAVSLASSLIVTTAGWWWTLRRKQKDEHARLMADAWTAVQAYKEFAFAIPRRSPDDPAGERVRISEALRAVQQNLSFHTAWIRGVSHDVSVRYDALVGETRKTAGRLMREAWQRPPIDSDTGMNMPEVAAELAGLRAVENAFLDAVQQHLYPIRWRRGRIRRS